MRTIHPGTVDDAVVAVLPSVTIISNGRRLFVTRESRHWASRSLPCGNVGSESHAALIARDPANTLWIACGGIPGIRGEQRKAFFRTHDLGEHWTEVRPRVSSAHGLMSGVLGSIGAPAPGVLLLTRFRAPPAISRDGGRSWTVALEPPGAFYGDPAPGWQSFVSAKRGYIGLFEDRVYLTADGGRTWTAVEIP
jgi:photosystem II stability/assembly factor-like uncharacterized protein